MPVCFVGSIRLSDVPTARTPWQGRVRHLLLAAAIGLLVAGQAAAQEAGEPDSAQAAVPAASQTARPGKDGKVCEYQVVTGSKMKKKVCHTAEQWEARERAAKQMTRELDGKAIGADANGG